MLQKNSINCLVSKIDKEDGVKIKSKGKLDAAEEFDKLFGKQDR